MNKPFRMKSSTYKFRDQVDEVTVYFKSWNECEQTVALYSLMRIIKPTQAKFLMQVIEHGSAAEPADIQIAQRNANDPGYISGLCSESKEQAVASLLSLLPLLRPGNKDAKEAFLAILPKILSHSFENGCHIEESRQLLSYSLIHPAMNIEERAQFKLWLAELESYEYTVVGTGTSSQVDAVLQQNGLAPPLHNTTYRSKSIDDTALDNKVARNRDSGIGVEMIGPIPPPLTFQPSVFNLQHGMAAAASSQQQQYLQQNGQRFPSLFTSSTSAVVVTCTSSACTSSSSSSSPLSCGGGTTCVVSSTRLHLDHPPLHASHSGPPVFTSCSSSSSAAAAAAAAALSQYQQQQLLQKGLLPVASGMNGHRKLSRSASPLTANANTASSGANNNSSVSDWLNRHHEEFLSGGGNTVVSSMSSSLAPSLHPPLSPQSSLASSGSERDRELEEQGEQQYGGGGGAGGGGAGEQQLGTHNAFLEEGSGMRDVPIWLKSLRLHKYSYLFQQMTYEELLTRTEDWLEAQNVTKGARNKIILSILKLQKRSEQLQAMEKDIMESGNLKQALTGIKSMLNTPIKRYKKRESEEAELLYVDDLPGQITRVIGKLCTQLLVTSHVDDECYTLYLQLLDKSLQHEAFTSEQKKKLSTWKQQIQKNWHPVPAGNKLLYDRQRKSLGASSVMCGAGGVRGTTGVQRTLRSVQQQQQQTVAASSPLNSQQHLLAAAVAAAGWNYNAVPGPALAPELAAAAAVAAAANPFLRNLNNVPCSSTSGGVAGSSAYPLSSRTLHSYGEMKQAVTRTHSAPIAKSSPYLSLARPVGADMSITEPELTARLDSLCLSMTEAALEGGSTASTGTTHDKGCTF